MCESKKWFSKKTMYKFAKQTGQVVCVFCKWLFTFYFIFHTSNCVLRIDVFGFLVHHQQNVVFKRWKNPVTLPLWIAMLIRKLRVRRKLLKQAKHALHSVAQWVEITSNIAFIEFLSFIHNLAIILKGQIRKIK